MKAELRFCDNAYICTKFRENISKGFSVIERTRFPCSVPIVVTDRQADRQTDRQTTMGITKCPPQIPDGGGMRGVKES